MPFLGSKMVVCSWMWKRSSMGKKKKTNHKAWGIPKTLHLSSEVKEKLQDPRKSPF